jgi:hypothetical protein
VGEIRVDQMVWESSVVMRLWVVGKGSTMRWELHGIKARKQKWYGMFWAVHGLLKTTALQNPTSSQWCTMKLSVMRQVWRLKGHDGRWKPKAEVSVVPVHHPGPHCWLLSAQALWGSRQ